MLVKDTMYWAVGDCAFLVVPTIGTLTKITPAVLYWSDLSGVSNTTKTSTGKRRSHAQSVCVYGIGCDRGVPGRLFCRDTLDGFRLRDVFFSCGINHLGGGNFSWLSP